MTDTKDKSTTQETKSTAIVLPDLAKPSMLDPLFALVPLPVQ
jgi:hypothetical protein